MACSSIKYLIKEINSDNKAQSDAFHAFIDSTETALAALLIMNRKDIGRLPVVYLKEASA
jgi:hypothetical protein